MMMTTESWLALLAGIPLTMGYACRVAKVNWWDYKLLPVLFHVLGGVQCIALLWVALSRGSIGFGWLGYGFAGVWLLWSYATWRVEAPEHAKSRPAPTC